MEMLQFAAGFFQTTIKQCIELLQTQAKALCTAVDFLLRLNCLQQPALRLESGSLHLKSQICGTLQPLRQEVERLGPRLTPTTGLASLQFAL